VRERRRRASISGFGFPRWRRVRLLNYLSRLGSGDDSFQVGVFAALTLPLLPFGSAFGAAMLLFLLLLLALLLSAAFLH
jgi:hypothetical protein